MRHHNNVRKFGRTTGQRNSLIKGLALSLIKREKIKTTEAKAKELRPFIEKLITRSKDATLNTKRLITATLLNRKPETKKLFETIAPLYKGRSGGYTRITKLAPRKSDGSKMAYIELVK